MGAWCPTAGPQHVKPAYHVNIRRPVVRAMAQAMETQGCRGGKGLQGMVQCSPLALSGVTRSWRHRAMSPRGLYIARSEGPTASLGKLCQGLTTLNSKKSFSLCLNLLQFVPTWS